MKKTQKARKKEVLSLLQKQKIRIIEQIDAYKNCRTERKGDSHHCHMPETG